MGAASNHLSNEALALVSLTQQLPWEKGIPTCPCEAYNCVCASCLLDGGRGPSSLSLVKDAEPRPEAAFDWGKPQSVF